MFGIEKTIKTALGDAEAWRRVYADEHSKHSELKGNYDRLVIENERLRNDLKWFMHRLNQVESERAAMFFQATGTRIAAPQFKEAPDPEIADVLNALGTPFAGVGDDSPDPADHLPEQEDGTEDYSHLPGYRGSR